MILQPKRALSLGGALLAAALGACRTAAPVPAPGHYIETRQPAKVWVTRADHSVVEVTGPHLVGDTLVGNEKTTRIPLDDVTQVSAPRLAVGRTVALVAVWGAAVGTGLVYIFSHNPSGNSKNVCLTPNDFSNYCGSILGP